MAYKIWLGVNGQRELRHATYGNINRGKYDGNLRNKLIRESIFIRYTMYME
jgi:hypothetical protein